ncbi:ATP-dependent DNA helicase DDX11 [Juglans microcarpa x Juglans regia]|uniref:ATP-dependent DNA helicase DDX11 n=1 Tax=Juglans microcarpa x Juglans regia TaxID=2249226 RepID=UPI001B7E6DC5|nr:ATP-dependent DNA helicase DDX11 [Juglans microcarpa x Juglans regia]
MGEGSWHSKFPAFPYNPYSIQIDFMNALYHSLNQGGVSMLESPTGTGKTLSIICSALQWVVDRRKQQNSERAGEFDNNPANEGQLGSEDEPDWMRDFVMNKDNKVELKKIKMKKFGVGFGKPDKRSNQGSCKDLFSLGSKEEDFVTKKERENMQKKNDAVQLTDEEFLLEDYESEEEGAGGTSKRKAGKGPHIPSSDEEEEEDQSDEEEDEEKLKVYFCSRTHSQLSQFIKELRKTVFANEVKIVCLGSRKNFCINEGVLKLGNSTRINDQCLELQKNKKKEVSKIKNLDTGGRIRRTKASSGCPMLRKSKLQRQFRSEVSQQAALDIEDLVSIGRKMGTCPYYGSRSMLPAADLVVLPYQSLLSKSSRESLGLKLKNNIVIIDEAHNLADSLISMYDSKITLMQLENVHFHVERYFERFRNLLGPGNRRYIQTLMVVSRAFLQILHENASYVDPSQDTEKTYGANGSSDSSLAINDFLFSLDIDNINLVKLLQYIKESNIMYKVSGYGDKMASLQNCSTKHDTSECNEGSILPDFRALSNMLQSLTNNDGDGRIILSRSQTTCSRQGGYIKYVMLSGEKIFSEIVNQAHAVLLAGGTLQPIEETRERLFPWLPTNQLQFFSCSHIVPPESILPVAVSCGPSGQSFDFSYSSRSSLIMIQELGLMLCNLVTVVPEGIVVFFSSFDYEGQVYDAWKASGILDRIMKKKCVFREPRKTTDVESVLKEYKETIDALCVEESKGNPASRSGAILLAVVGGKISEGINLSDGMGRCIVMVGLPYPNPSDIELIERVKHIEGLGNSKCITSKFSVTNEPYNGDVEVGFDILRSCRRRGKEYYENLCMKAVNQSIGRAIRHVNDYAAILLVDARYGSDPSNRNFSNTTNKLPQWIKERLVFSTQSYGEVHRLLHQFFKFNKKKRECK